MDDNLILDTGPLGMITHPRENEEIKEWFKTQIKNGKKIIIPEIADYELRRELLRGDKKKGIERLNTLEIKLLYLPLTTETILKAAEFWSTIRKAGKPTADDKSLDGDVILAAQAFIFGKDGQEVLVVSDNVGHLSRFVKALSWRDI